MFGTPLDVTVSELSIESFFPADSVTAEAVAASFESRRERRRGPVR
jgi:hypothetical protein